MAPIREVRAEIWDNNALINVIVTVTDEQGNEGVGETWWGIRDKAVPARGGRPMASVVNDILGPRLVGREASDIADIWADSVDWAARYGDQGILMMGLSGIDLALWDLRSKSTGQPVVDLLGGSRFSSLKAYASLPWYYEAAPVLAETARALDAGFHAVKLHEVDPAITTQLRREFGDDLIVIVDVNGYFDEHEAVEHAKHLTDMGVLWFEEPVRPMRDHQAIARVAQAVDCDIAGGENEYTVADFEALLSTTPIRYVQPELTKTGGLTSTPQITEIVERHERELVSALFPRWAVDDRVDALGLLVASKYMDRTAVVTRRRVVLLSDAAANRRGWTRSAHQRTRAQQHGDQSPTAAPHGADGTVPLMM